MRSGPALLVYTEDKNIAKGDGDGGINKVSTYRLYNYISMEIP